MPSCALSQKDCRALKCTDFQEDGAKCLLVATRDAPLVIGESIAAGDLARLARSGNSLASRKLPNSRLGTAIALESRPRAGAGMRPAAGMGQPPGEGTICDEAGNSAPLLLCNIHTKGHHNAPPMPLQVHVCQYALSPCLFSPHTRNPPLLASLHCMECHLKRYT